MKIIPGCVLAICIFVAWKTPGETVFGERSISYAWVVLCVVGLPWIATLLER